MATLVLASRSPRRHEALTALGVSFEVAVSRAEETLPPLADTTDPVPVAAAKALDVAATHPESVVLAGDTIVVIDGKALGKPASPDHARAMLRRLSGRQHHVRTGLTLQRDGETTTAEVACPLRMRPYSDAEIEAYVESGEPLDCAGAYDVHRLGGALVERVEGCFSTVVGLPIVQAARMLAAAGIPIPRAPTAVCTALYGRRCLAEDPSTLPACLAHARDGGGRTPP